MFEYRKGVKEGKAIPVPGWGGLMLIKVECISGTSSPKKWILKAVALKIPTEVLQFLIISIKLYYKWQHSIRTLCHPHLPVGHSSASRHCYTAAHLLLML
jgi:hypothetical protein